MRFQPRRAEEPDLNMTSLIDVVLLLLMMAYVTIFGDLPRIARESKAEAQAKAAAAEQQKKAAAPAKP